MHPHPSVSLSLCLSVSLTPFSSVSIVDLEQVKVSWEINSSQCFFTSHTHTHARTHARTHTHACTHARTHTHACTHTCTHAQTHKEIRQSYIHIQNTIQSVQMGNCFNDHQQ